MKKRQQIVAGNWKMHKDYEDGRDLAKEIVDKLQPADAIVVLATPYIHLKSVASTIEGVANLHLAAQNCHHKESGAYTGEISAEMLASVGVKYVILGHSERREYFGEDEALLAQKVNIVLKHKMIPMFCCGEKLAVREAGEYKELVAQQIKGGLFHLSAEDFGKVVIAYEPVWAIGTGVTASPAQAQEMHAFIRELVAAQYGPEAAEQVSILYGGSVKPDNAAELFGQADVDGGLVGGASLSGSDFVAIVQSL